MGSRVPPAEAIRVACATAGFDASDASVLYDRANTVFKLAGAPVVARVRYTRGSAAWVERLTASVRVTAWLNDQGFPVVRPADAPQPVSADGYVVTFWDFVDVARPPWEDVDTLGQLLRRLHSLGMPPGELPATSPLGSMLEDTSRNTWLDERRRTWLLGRLEELQRRYESETWVLGRGLVHGDAYAENLIHGQDGAVLGDWDSVSYGPREQDIVPTSIRHRFGRPRAEWDGFCAAYGVNPDELPGLAVLREMREVRTLVPYIRSAGHPAAQAEVRKRIDDLMNGTQREPWRALNLDS